MTRHPSKPMSDKASTKSSQEKKSRETPWKSESDLETLSAQETRKWMDNTVRWITELMDSVHKHKDKWRHDKSLPRTIKQDLSNSITEARLIVNKLKLSLSLSESQETNPDIRAEILKFQDQLKQTLARIPGYEIIEESQLSRVDTETEKSDGSGYPLSPQGSNTTAPASPTSSRYGSSHGSPISSRGTRPDVPARPTVSHPEAAQEVFYGEAITTPGEERVELRALNRRFGVVFPELPEDDNFF